MTTTNAGKVVVQFEADIARYRQNLQQIGVSSTGYTRQAKTATAANDALNRSFRGAAQGVAAVDGPLGGVASRISAVNSLVTSGALGWSLLGTAVAGTAFALVSAAREGAQVERQLLKTEALLNATGFAAGRSADQLDNNARALARYTLASTEGVRSAQQVLLTFRAVSGPIFDDTIRLSQDLAAVMGGDIKSAAQQLGRALEDPEQGLTALRRSGVSFTNAEREMVISMFQAGQEADAQRLILQKLEQQIGGAGAAEGAGVIGAVDGLQQSWGELLEALNQSTGASGAANSLISGLDNVLQGVKRGISPGDNQRYFELKTQQRETEREIARLEALDSRRANAQANRLRSSLLPIERELAEVQQRFYDEQQSREEAAEQGREVREQLRADREDAARAEREKKENEAIKRQEQRERELAARQAEREKAETERALAQQADRFSRIHELALQADGRVVELAQYRNQREREQLEAEMEFLRERNALTADLEEEFRIAREEQELIHAQRLADIEDKRRKDRLKEEEQNYNNVLSLAETYNNARIGGVNRYAAVALQIGRTLISAERRDALTKAKLDGKVAMQKAVASAPPPANFPAIAWAGVQTAANISSIAGIAHGGMASVPKEATYLLDKGERVLSPKQNQDLVDFMGKGGGVNVVVHNHGSDQVNVRQNGNDVEVMVGQVINRLGDQVSRGNGFANVLQDAYPALTRRGRA